MPSNMMQPVGASEFWSGFWANALSEILFGVVFAALFTLLFNHLLNRRNITDLHISAGAPYRSEWASIPISPPRHAGSIACADVQIGLRNTGSVAGKNWLVRLRLPRCTIPTTRQQVIRFEPPPSPMNFNVDAQQYGFDESSGEITLELRYVSPSDLVHSGSDNRNDPHTQFTINFLPGYESVMNDLRFKSHVLRKVGSYEIYADHMKPKTDGRMSLLVDTKKGTVDLMFS